MNLIKAIAALVALPATAKLSVAEVRPTDVLVVECDHYLSMEEMHQIKSSMELVWPGRKVAVFGKGLRLKITQESAA